MESKKLFEGLNFLLIRNYNSSDSITECIALLKEYGCTSAEILDIDTEQIPKDSKTWFSNKYSSSDIHFIISNDCNFLFYNAAAFDFLIPVVRQDWIKQCIKTKRHVRTLLFSPDSRHILRHCQIYVSSHIFQNSNDYLFCTELIHSLGGTCVNFISTKTTHIIATTPSDPAVEAVLKHSSSKPINFVYPTWVFHCFKEGKLVDIKDHLLEVSGSYANSEKLNNMWDLVMELDFSNTLNEHNYLEGQKFLISMDLSLSKEIYTILLQFIKYNGGKIYHQLNESDVVDHQDLYNCYLGYSTKAKEYELLTSKNISMDGNKNIGNIIWLFNMWSMSEFIPSSYNNGKITFRPFGPKVFTKKSLVVTYTNYFGQQRFYIQRLVEILGGISTTEMSKKNTHLISRLPMGRKFITAQKWQADGVCALVNHLWLENCYRKGMQLDTHIREFIDFDSIRKYITLCLGQMCFGAKLNESNSEPPTQVTTGLPKKIENNIMKSHIVSQYSVLKKEIPHLSSPQVVDTTNEITPENLGKTESEHESSAETFYEPNEAVSKNGISNIIEKLAKEPAAKDDIFGGLSSDFEEEEKKNNKSITIAAKDQSNPNIDKEKTLVPKTIGQLGGSRQSSNIDNVLCRESSDLFSSGGSRRAAKSQAAKRLHDDIESLNEFEKHKLKHRKGGVDLLPQEKEHIKKSKELEIEAREILEKCSYYEVGSNGRKSKRYNFKMNCICTGCHFDDMTPLNTAILEQMGIKIFNEDYEDIEGKINCVIAPKIMRTSKFLKSLGFKSLSYALLPEFIVDLLKKVHKEKPISAERLSNIDNYFIPGITEDLLKKTTNDKKLFERAFISKINLVNDIPGGSSVISSILKEHGITEVNVVNNKDLISIEKISSNVNGPFTNKDKREIKSTYEGLKVPPKYILVATKPAQVKKFKKLIIDNENYDNDGVLIVNWDWCVDCIFRLDVDYITKKDVFYSNI